MARYEIKAEEIQKYSDAVKGKFNNAVRKFGLTAEGDTFYADNKKIYNTFKSALARETGDEEYAEKSKPVVAKKAGYGKAKDVNPEYEAKVKSGVATWKKGADGKWYVLINSSYSLTFGTKVEVEKKDGTRETVKLGMVKQKTDSGYLYFCTRVRTSFGSEDKSFAAPSKSEATPRRTEKPAQEKTKYIEVPVMYNIRIPDEGGILIRHEKAYKVLSSTYVPDGWDDYNEEDIFEHYRLGVIDLTDTEEGQRLIAEETARQEAKKAEYQNRRDLIKLIKEKGVEASGAIPEGEVLYDTFRIDGTGEKIIQTDTELWYIANNGMDGDNWSRNTIITGGAGAYGWRAPRSK